MSESDFIKSATYFELLYEIAANSERLFKVKSLYALNMFIHGYLFCESRHDVVEIGFNRLNDKLIFIIDNTEFSYMEWPAALIKKCGNEDAAYEYMLDYLWQESQEEDRDATA